MNRLWLKHYPVHVPKNLNYPNVSLVQLLKKAVQRHQNEAALDFFGKVLTYNDLWREICILAASLGALNIKRGDRVAILLPNSPQFVISYYAILMLGAVVVPINPLLSNGECLEIIEDSGAKIIIGLDILLPKISAVSNKIIVVTSVTDYLKLPYKLLYKIKSWKEKKYEPKENIRAFSFVELLSRKALLELDLSASDNLAVLIYTSGTTSRPKGVMLTHKNLVANTLQCHSWVPDPDLNKKIFIGVMPFFHAYGMTVCMNTALAFGGTIILLPKFSPKKVIRVIKKNKANVLIGVEAIYIALLKYEKQLRKVKSLQVCISGSYPIKKKAQEKFEMLTGSFISEGYGLSEASPVTHNNPLVGLRKLGSIGIPYPDTDAKIVSLDDKDLTLEPNQEGELLVKGPQIMKGYWRQPEATAAAFHRGWLCTGDKAMVDADGFFFFIERISDCINVGGENVSAFAVEKVIGKHPQVQEVAVVEAPHSFFGGCVKAFIVPKSNHALTEKEVVDFCKGKLAPFAIPKIVKIKTALPKNVLGKILKKELKKEN